MARPEYDEPTLAEWESEVDEKDELLARKRWLLLHHPDFIAELREVEKAAGKRLPIGRVWPYEMALDWKYLRELDKHGTPRHAFIGKYDLFPMQSGELHFALAHLRKLAEDGKWGKWDKDTFNRHAWWYELKHSGKSDNEIKELALNNKFYWIFLEIRTLAYWQKEEAEYFTHLCKIAEVPTEKQTPLDKLNLLYFLNRFRLGKGKGKLGLPRRQFPPLDGGSREIQTGREYFVHVNYEWPEGLFSESPDLACDEKLKELRDDYLWYRDEYLGESHNAPMHVMIRKARKDMKEKIEKIYKFYQEK